MNDTETGKYADEMERSIKEFDREKFEKEFEKFIEKWFGESSEQKKAC